MKNSKPKKVSKKTLRNELHFAAQLKFRGLVSQDKTKIIPRKQKNNRVEY